MDVHFVAVSANRIVAVDITVAVHEIVHVTVIPLAVRDDILKVITLASESRANNSSATSCSVAKWVRCCFPSKKEKPF